MMTSFRLIESGFCDAATNMAVDEALFLSSLERTGIPALRLYGWDHAALSIGYGQNPSSVLNLDALKEKRIDFVRRPTGGGILFHDNELTYSVVGSSDDFGASRSIRDSFEKITSFLIEAFRMLGAPAAFSKKRADDPNALADFCFSRKEEYDILINGKKIGGNAQRRKNNLILQHGALPLTFDKNKVRVFLKKPGAVVDCDITTIQEITRGKATYHSLGDTLVRAFCLHFHARIIQSELTPQEQQIARELKMRKYEKDSWNYFRH